MLENLKSLKYLPTVYRDSSQRLRTDLQARIEAAGLRARPVFAELMTALTLLHHGMVNKRKSGRQYPEFTSVYGHEVATLNFADQFGFKFLENKIIMIDCHHHPHRPQQERHQR